MNRAKRLMNEKYEIYGYCHKSGVIEWVTHGGNKYKRNEPEDICHRVMQRKLQV